jgi:hypothetical protein
MRRGEIAAGVVDFCIGVEVGANRGGEADVEKCADVPGGGTKRAMRSKSSAAVRADIAWELRKRLAELGS